MGHADSERTWHACSFAAFHAHQQPLDEPVDADEPYVYDYAGVRLQMRPDDLDEGGVKLTWRLWSAAAHGLGMEVARQHFDKEFQFVILQDWPAGQQDTQRVLGHGSLTSLRSRSRADVKLGKNDGNSTAETA